MSVPAGAKGDGDDLRILILAPSGRDARLAEQTLARSGLSRQICADFEAPTGCHYRPGPGNSRR